ncbi:hypothetical protein PS720_02795 [Pseudomonas fluorescens]|nr:hypothetical protein PS720_02795 [Pseudomonas fluorescens]
MVVIHNHPLSTKSNHLEHFRPHLNSNAISPILKSGSTLMSNTKVPYSKSLEDELDWKMVDQLHSAVSQISGFCFESKKLCVSIEFIVVGIIASFTKDSSGNSALDHSIFVAALLIPLCFWFLDSVAYYYQSKLRVKMEEIRGDIAKRSNNKSIMSIGHPFIEKNRTGLSQFIQVRKACLNHSMWLYFLMIVIDFSIWILFYTKIIS